MTAQPPARERVIIPLEAVSHGHHFPPGRGLVVGVGLWIWLLEEGVPVGDSQRNFRIAFRGCHGSMEYEGALQ